MSFVSNRLPLLLSVVASLSILHGVDKDKKKWAPGPASSFSTKQTNTDVTIAAQALHTEALISEPFSKVNPYKHGVLPVLIVIQNDSKQAIRLDSLKVQYIDADRSKLDATPASEVPYLKPPERPTFATTPLPGLGRKKKNQLADPEIEIRAFSAKMLPPGESAHGLFYFRTRHMPNAKMYVTGLEQANTGQELLYYEIPLDY